MAKSSGSNYSQSPFTEEDHNANYVSNAGSFLPTMGSGEARQGINYASKAMGSSGGGTPWGAIGSFAKTGYNTLTGHDDKNYSDVEQEIVYPLQGASMGAGIAPPWGAIIGALYGLGYGFRDDLGFIRNNKWLDDMVFPIKLDE